MKIEVDISPRFEKHKTTYLAMGGSIEDCISLSWKEYRLLFTLTAEREHKRGRRKNNGRSLKKQKIRVYTIMCYLLLKPHLHRLTHIDIDRDFQGHKQGITADLKNMMLKAGYDWGRFEINAEAKAGKGSAHMIANQCRLKKRDSRPVTAEDIFTYY